MALEDWSTNPNENTTVGPVNIAENCPAANMNNMGREIMAQVKAWADGLPDEFQESNAKLSALADLALAANRLIYATGTEALATTPLSPFMRTLLDDETASAARSTIGSIGVPATQLAANGRVEFSLPGTSSIFMVQWGRGTLGPNSIGAINYPKNFTSFSICLCGGGGTSTSTADQVRRYGAASTSGASIINPDDNNSLIYEWIAVGV